MESKLYRYLLENELCRNITLLYAGSHCLQSRAACNGVNVDDLEIKLGLEAATMYIDILQTQQRPQNDRITKLLIEAFNILLALKDQYGITTEEVNENVSPITEEAYDSDPSGSRMKLIQLVKDTPYLYDKSHSLNHRPEIRVVGWNKIGFQLGIPAQDAVKKWTSLRDRYKRELNRMCKLSAMGQAYCPTWECYPLLHAMLYKNYIKDIEKSEISYTDDYVDAPFSYTQYRPDRRKAPTVETPKNRTLKASNEKPNRTKISPSIDSGVAAKRCLRFGSHDDEFINLNSDKAQSEQKAAHTDEEFVRRLDEDLSVIERLALLKQRSIRKRSCSGQLELVKTLNTEYCKNLDLDLDQSLEIGFVGGGLHQLANKRSRISLH